MWDEATVALATAVGSGVLQAAGTDGWLAFRSGLARLFGRGDAREESAQLQRLDLSAAELAAAAGPDGSGPQGGGDEERTRIRTAWRPRTEDLLGALDADERASLAAGIRALLEETARSARPAAGGITGNVFHGPAAVQSGNDSVQLNRFDSRP
ncbi:hypothetical protein ACGFXC_04665 [Streptomyces sp. NPDC048507]|uniref:hypothetical protein n=1 Tax=Streptomyces sp. NPDC048507 TaxID=3365560 RepID=UPI003711B583